MSYTSISMETDIVEKLEFLQNTHLFSNRSNMMRLLVNKAYEEEMRTIGRFCNRPYLCLNRKIGNELVKDSLSYSFIEITKELSETRVRHMFKTLFIDKGLKTLKEVLAEMFAEYFSKKLGAKAKEAMME